MNGIETFFFSDPRSGRLASYLQQQMMDVSPGTPNRGVRRGRFFVIRRSTMPSALVEMGFVTGAIDAPRLAKADPSPPPGLGPGGRHPQLPQAGGAMTKQLLGFFDSGLGGLTVLRRVLERHGPVPWYTQGTGPWRSSTRRRTVRPPRPLSKNPSSCFVIAPPA